MRPDLTILLDIDASEGLARARVRNSRHGLGAEARFENEQLPFHERVRRGYLELARREPGRFRVVDASPQPEVVQGEIRKVVDEMLNAQAQIAN
jgi:dTMP kinase